MQGCPTGYPYGSVKIFPRSKVHIRMQIKITQNLAIYYEKRERELLEKEAYNATIVPMTKNVTIILVSMYGNLTPTHTGTTL